MSWRRRARRRLSAVVVAFLAVVVPPAPVADAKVVVDETSSQYTIRVEIDLIGGEDDIAAKWNEAIRDYWNDGPGLGRFKYCGKAVEFVPDIQPIAAGQPGRPDAAKIRMQLVREGLPFISNVRGVDPTRNSTGTWGSNEDDATIAHEFGHILGLRDEYVWVPFTDTDANGKWDPGEPTNDDLNHNGKRDPSEPTHPKPGFAGSIMAEAAGTVQQRHIEAALRGIRGLRCWRAELDLHTTRDYNPAGDPSLGPQTCEDDWTARFDARVDAEGAVSGNGTATLSGGPVCTFDLGVDSGRSATFEVAGTMSGQGFELTFTLTEIELPGDFGGFQASLFGLTGVGPSVAVPVTGATSAQADMHLAGDIAGSPITADGTITMTCEDCEEEAVG